MSGIRSRHLDRVCRPDLANAHVAKGDFGVGLDLDNVLGQTFFLGAGSSAGALSVEPLHGIALAPPDRHGENHAAGHGIAHLGCAAQTKIIIRVRSLAVLIGDDVSSNLGRSRKSDDSGLDNLAVLDVVAVHLLEVALLVGGELRDDGELAGCVDLEFLAAAVKVSDIVAVVVPAAASLVADALLLALVACAAVQAGDAAGVGSDVGSARVGFPDIHLVTADTLALDVALNNQLVEFKINSIRFTYNSVDERSDIALSITVSSTLSSTKSAVSACALTTIGRHLRKVQSTIHTARKLLSLNVERELSTGKLEHLILLLVLLKKVNTRRNRLAISQHLQTKSAARGSDTLGLVRSQVHARELAVLGTCLLIRASLGVSGFTPVTTVLAVGLADAMEFSVGDDVVCRLLAAARFGAAVGVDLGVHLLCLVGSLADGDVGQEG